MMIKQYLIHFSLLIAIVPLIKTNVHVAMVNFFNLYMYLSKLQTRSEFNYEFMVHYKIVMTKFKAFLGHF